ncbi:putative secreted protein [Propionispora sp. 2/2-37]|uniref:BMC domain-containing protein n=1 Tax=Propionispora sp. 2/2-37 TaxID=1677858 RepID=UPI0006BB75E5|nr:BMC domain-containing protein [Propionispora sp. 2/2-37]CUH94327.1 putative secreted protein [Propionispora sp. 2/2-37]
MRQQALGMIETVGLSTAVTVADAAVKAANVSLLGYELSRGGGMVLVKVAGDVGAVKAAVEAGKAAAAGVGQVYAVQVIPRPHTEIASLVYSRATVGLPSSASSGSGKEQHDAGESKPVTDPPENSAGKEVPETAESAGSAEAAVETREAAGEESADGTQTRTISCNLCGDPACPRNKGEARNNCLHYGKTSEESEET